MGSDSERWECFHLSDEGTVNVPSRSQLNFVLQVAAPIVSDKTCQERVCNLNFGLFKIQNCIIADNHICAGGLGGKGPGKVKAARTDCWFEAEYCRETRGEHCWLRTRISVDGQQWAWCPTSLEDCVGLTSTSSTRSSASSSTGLLSSTTSCPLNTTQSSGNNLKFIVTTM